MNTQVASIEAGKSIPSRSSTSCSGSSSSNSSRNSCNTRHSNNTMTTSSSSKRKKANKSSSNNHNDYNNNPFGPVIGELKASFSCQYNNEKGTLYVATLAICFRRTALFGLEASREIIPWRTVHSVYTNDEDGFSIRTFAGKVYDFKNIETNVEYALQLCTKVSENAKKNQCPKHHNMMNSVKNGTCNSVQQERDVTAFIHRTFSMDCNSRDDVNNDGDDEETLLSAERVIDFISTSLGSCLNVKDDQTLDNDSDDSDLSFGSEQGFEVKYDESHPDQDAQIQKQAWRDCLESKEPSFQMTPFMNLHLKCDIDQFYNLYVTDNAPYSLVAFHQNETDDYDVKHTSWTQNIDKNDSSSSFTRTISYTHPNTAPMAPPTSFSTKTQQMNRYGKYGICINTKTVIEGVPMADTFYVEDRLLIEGQEDGGVLISAMLDVRFVKSTFFQKIIERNSKSEVNDFLVKFGEYLKSTSERTDNEDEEEEVKTLFVVESSSMEEDEEQENESKEPVSNRTKTHSSLTLDETEVIETESLITSTTGQSASSSRMQILIVLLILFQIHSMYQLQQANNRISLLEDVLLAEGQCGV